LLHKIKPKLKIGVISDTHSSLDPRFYEFLKDCDEVWHAGDIGDAKIVDDLEAFKPLMAVYGNIDDAKMRLRYPLNAIFERAGLKILITHIAGYPGKYNARVKALILKEKPHIVVVGHSHILKVIYDKDLQHLHINPGAAGLHGWHKVRTAIRFEIINSQPTKLEIFELPRHL